MTKIIVANWKMNGTSSFIEAFFQNWNLSSNQNTIIFAPSFPYITMVRSFTSLTAGQDCHEEKEGAYTGNVSAAMLADLGCQYVILGHSERRQHHRETNAMVKNKAKQALFYNLTPIICVGESLIERQSGRAIETVLTQLKECLPQDHNLIVAYEPIWAIGTGLTATEKEIAEMHQAIADVYPNLKVLYGGSVNEKNAHQIMKLAHVDGVLVGGASLKGDTFKVICQG